MLLIDNFPLFPFFSTHITSHHTMALFLGRLTPDTRSRDLEDLFAKYGRVTRLDIKRGNLIRLYFSNQTWN